MLLIYDEMVSKFWDSTCLVIKCQDKSRKFRRNHRAISFKYASWQLTSHHIEDFGVFSGNHFHAIFHGFSVFIIILMFFPSNPLKIFM